MGDNDVKETAGISVNNIAASSPFYMDLTQLTIISFV